MSARLNIAFDASAATVRKIMGRQLLDELKKPPEQCATTFCIRLINAGASLSERDEKGWNALNWVAHHGHYEAITLTMLHADVECIAMTPKDRQEAVAMAIKRDNIDTATFILQVPLENKLRASAMAEEIYKPRQTDGGALIALDASPESMKRAMGRMLLEEVMNPECDTAKALRLVGEGASLAERDKNRGWSALKWIAYQGHSPILARIMLFNDMECRALPQPERNEAVKIARENGNREIAQAIQGHEGLQKRAAHEMTARRHVKKNLPS